MNCREFLERLEDYIDPQTATELRAELDTHAFGCSHCQVTLNTTRKTVEIYRNNELYELPQNLREKIQEAVMKKCSKMREANKDCSGSTSE